MKNKILHILLFLAFGSITTVPVWSQNGFTLPKEKKQGKLKFELVNNLVVIPVEINDIKLSFILDTGVSSTLLFGATKDTLALKNTYTVMLRGLGKGEAVEALKSDGNLMKVGETIDVNHSLNVVFDESLNFSSRMGVPIHGILGYNFFKNFVVTINYSNKTIRYATPDHFKERRKKGFTTYPLRIAKGRPFINNVVVNDNMPSLMLIDTGSSDSIWVFDDNDLTSEIEKNYFDDFLGLGLSGSIYGKRSRVSDVSIGTFNFQDVNIAIPEPEAIATTNMMVGRKGSIGAQLMKRFNIIFNYPKSEISLKKNANYKAPFYYNMSGLTIEYSGLSIVKNKTGSVKKITDIKGDRDSATVLFDVAPIYDILLTPSVIVAEVRENSAAGLVDIRVGDELLSVNGKPVYEYKLYEITSLFSSKEGKLISLKINRQGHLFKKKFHLKKIF